MTLLVMRALGQLMLKMGCFVFADQSLNFSTLKFVRSHLAHFSSRISVAVHRFGREPEHT